MAWRAIYRTMRAIDRLVRSWIANDLPGLNGVVEMRFVGRRTGRRRRILITLLSVNGRWYVGHPNGEASWVRDTETSGWVDIEPPGRRGPRFSIHRLAAGPERDAVIRSTVRQQPFPANLVYRASQRHVAAVGVYHRLDPVLTDGAAADTAEGAWRTDP
jgi:hypothetical protein